MPAADPAARRAPRVWCGPAARLALRRAAGPASLAVLAALAGAVALRDWTPRSLVDALDAEGAAEGARLARGFARQAAWATTAWLALPLFAWRGARAFATWRLGEGDWLAASPAGIPAVVGSTLVGHLVGGALVVGACALAIEAALGLPLDRAPALVWSREVADPPRVAPGGELEVRLGVPARATVDTVRARLRPTYGASPASEVRIALARGAQVARAVESPPLVVSGHVALELAVPPGAGSIVWHLRDVGDGAVALDDRATFEAWCAVEPEARASLRFALRALAALAAASALAFGFGAWVSTPTATAGALAAVGTWSALAPGWSPAAGLSAAFEHLAQGRIPGALGGPAALAAAAAVLGGLGLAAAAGRRWGRAA